LKQALYNPLPINNSSTLFAFGTILDNRNFGNSPRVGFNGKESDDEIKGEGNSQDYGMRIYDNRLGRFLSIDPIAKKFPMLSVYQFASNTPIQAVDLDGLEARIYLDLSFPIGHAFISVTDNNGILHVYTYGQYKQGHNEDSNKPIGQGALVHLVGEAANEYIKSEIKTTIGKFAVYEVSKSDVDKDKIIEYYSNEMKGKPSAEIEKTDVSALEAVRGDETGKSSAVKYKVYVGVPDLLPDNVKKASGAGNCVTTVADGLNAGGSDVLSGYSIPQTAHAKLLFSSATNVTGDAVVKAYKNVGSQTYKPLVFPKLEFKPVPVVPTFIKDNTKLSTPIVVPTNPEPSNNSTGNSNSNTTTNEPTSKARF